MCLCLLDCDKVVRGLRKIKFWGKRKDEFEIKKLEKKYCLDKCGYDNLEKYIEEVRLK